MKLSKVLLCVLTGMMFLASNSFNRKSAYGALSAETLSDETLSDETISAQTISAQTISAQTISAQTISAHKQAAKVSAPIIYSGTSPCAGSARAFLQIPSTEKCDWVKWKLSLFNEMLSNGTSKFSLDREHIFFIDNSTSESKGKITIEGTWKLTKGTKSNSEAQVCQLQSGQKYLSLVKLDNNLLHLLEADKSLMIGDGGQSFTLSINKPAQIAGATGAVPTFAGNSAATNSAATNSATTNSATTNNATTNNATTNNATTNNATTKNSPSITSIKKQILAISDIRDTMLHFVGRSPCSEIARNLQIPAGSDCAKIKWNLKLFQDPVNFRPTRYELSRTFHRESIIEGKWQIIKGTSTNPDAIIYQLDPGSQQSVFLLKGDDNVLFFINPGGGLLVGNQEYSYTLNRRK
jgi:hypothetical protein